MENAYIYTDIKRYGFSNKNIKVWVYLNEKSKIITVIMKYYEGMHIFSKNKILNIDQIIELIEKECPYLINAEKSIINCLNKYLKKKYLCSFGQAVFLDIKNLSQDNKANHEIRLALQKDYGLMADMIMKDIRWRTYFSRTSKAD